MILRIVQCVMAVCIVALAVGCAGPAISPSAPIATPVASTSCPPPGTVVPFSKVMNNAFVRDYQGCNIKTTAKYAGSLSGVPVFGLEKDHILIVVSSSGTAGGTYVALPKAGGELAFALKQGDSILLTGGTYAPITEGIGGAMQIGAVFVATTVALSR